MWSVLNGQHRANSWYSPIGHAVEQLGRFDLPMKVWVRKPFTTSFLARHCSEVLAILNDRCGCSELSSGSAANAASTVGAWGREVRTAPLELVMLYVKAPTSMARSKALVAIAAVLLCGTGQTSGPYTSLVSDVEGSYAEHGEPPLASLCQL